MAALCTKAFKSSEVRVLLGTLLFQLYVFSRARCRMGIGTAAAGLHMAEALRTRFRAEFGAEEVDGLEGSVGC